MSLEVELPQHDQDSVRWIPQGTRITALSTDIAWYALLPAITKTTRGMAKPLGSAFTS